MTSKVVAFDSGHTDMVHDAQLDYYGKRLATASSDRTVKIFEVGTNQEQKLVAELKGHDGPVWQVSWAHPKFGMLLASCSYDGKVIVWKEQQLNQWTQVYKQQSTNASVNSIAWASHTLGLMLAAACSDGTVSVFTHGDNQQWHEAKFMAHQAGCNAVSWGPDTPTGSLLSQGPPGAAVQQFVTGGCDKEVKVWRFDLSNGTWAPLPNFQDGHKDWVRDVAWAPSLGLLSNTIASCSEDKTVIIWAEDSNGQWKKQKELPFKHKVWKVSWSPMGNILAVSQGDNKVSLWKEAVDGDWQNLSTLQDDEAQEE